MRRYARGLVHSSGLAGREICSPQYPNGIVVATKMAPAKRSERSRMPNVYEIRSCINEAEKALQAGDHVLIDRCNFDSKQRSHFVNLRGAANTHRIAVFFDAEGGDAYDRIVRRTPQDFSREAMKTERKLRGIVAKMSKELRPPRLAGEGPHRFDSACAFARLRAPKCPSIDDGLRLAPCRGVPRDHLVQAR